MKVKVLQVEGPNEGNYGTYYRVQVQGLGSGESLWRSFSQGKAAGLRPGDVGTLVTENGELDGKLESWTIDESPQTAPRQESRNAPRANERPARTDSTNMSIEAQVAVKAATDILGHIIATMDERTAPEDMAAFAQAYMASLADAAYSAIQGMKGAS
jgi:hypothetical protein